VPNFLGCQIYCDTDGQVPYTSLSSVCAVLGTGIRETGDPVSKRGGDASNCWVVVALSLLERSGTGAGLEGPRSSLPVTSYPGRAMGGTLVTTSGRRGSVVGNGNSSFFEVATDRDASGCSLRCWRRYSSGLRGDRCVEVVRLSRWVLRLPFSWSYSLFSFSRCNSEYLRLLHTVLAVFSHKSSSSRSSITVPSCVGFPGNLSSVV